MTTFAWAAASPPPPTLLQVWLPSLLTAVASVLVGYFVYRSSRQANRTTDRATLSDQQLAWTRQAMTEAQEAKTEAKQALTAANVADSAAKTAQAAADAAASRADGAERRLREVSELADGLMDWISRVVRKSHVDGISDGAGPEVVELLRVINGGPPEITSDRLRRSRGEL